MGGMDHGRMAPIGSEFVIAARAAIIAVVCWFFAELLSGSSSPTGQSLTFLLWLATILAGTQAGVAAAIGVWRRTHQPRR